MCATHLKAFTSLMKEGRASKPFWMFALISGVA